jgi:hypothetical protein
VRIWSIDHFREKTDLAIKILIDSGLLVH